jgi:hypothetical protein
MAVTKPIFFVSAVLVAPHRTSPRAALVRCRLRRDSEQLFNLVSDGALMRGSR